MLAAPSVYTGTRPSMKLRTRRVEARWVSPAPKQAAGLTHTSGRPRAASRSASISASCTEFTYGIPSRPALNSWFSSAVLPHSAGPTAAALEVSTTRSTSARRLSSSTVLVPRTFTSNRQLGVLLARTEVSPAQ